MDPSIMGIGDDGEEDDDGEAGKSQSLAGGFGIEEADARSIESVQAAEDGKEKQDARAKKHDSPTPRVAFKEHGGIIEAGSGSGSRE